MADQEFTTEELESEEWRPILGYEGVYSASSLGRVRRDLTTTRARSGSVLKASLNRGGYYVLCVSKDNVRVTRTVHKLVALAFLGPRPDGYTINHKDCTKTNNRAANLEYCTGLENMRHAVEHGLMSTGARHSALIKPRTVRGERNHKHKLTAAQVREIRAKYQWRVYSANRLAKEYGVAKPSILAIIHRVTWVHI